MRDLSTEIIIDKFLEESNENENIYEQYKKWCNKNNYEIKSKGRFQKVCSKIVQEERLTYSRTQDKLIPKANKYFFLDLIMNNTLELNNGTIEKVFNKNGEWWFKNHFCECGCGENIKVTQTQWKTGKIKKFYNRFHKEYYDKLKKDNNPPKRDNRKSEYKIVYSPKHNRAIAYHRYVMEEFLGRELTSEENVHHIDLDKQNNNLNNLIVCNNSEHSKYHFGTWKLISELVKTGLVKFDKDGGYYFSGELASFMYD